MWNINERGEALDGGRQRAVDSGEDALNFGLSGSLGNPIVGLGHWFMVFLGIMV